MLTLPQLKDIQSRDPYTYEALRALQSYVNNLAHLLNLDGAAQNTPPPNIGSLSVVAADGIFDVAITDKQGPRRPIFYFAEYSASPNFTNPIVVDMGTTRNLRLQLGNQTLYWRAYSQYLGSPISAKVTFGTPPIALTGGGVNGPAPQPSQGSGGGSGVGGGFGDTAGSRGLFVQ